MTTDHSALGILHTPFVDLRPSVFFFHQIQWCTKTSSTKWSTVRRVMFGSVTVKSIWSIRLYDLKQPFLRTITYWHSQCMRNIFFNSSHFFADDTGGHLSPVFTVLLEEFMTHNFHPIYLGTVKGNEHEHPYIYKLFQNQPQIGCGIFYFFMEFSNFAKMSSQRKLPSINTF